MDQRTGTDQISSVKGLGYSLSHFKNFRGSLAGIMKEMWLNKSQKDPTFAAKPQPKEFTKANAEMLKVYIKEPTFSQQQKTAYAAQGNPEFLFSPSRHMGINTVGRLLQELCRKVGIVDWKDKTNHTLHQYLIMLLANDPNVNAQDVQKFAHHKTVLAQQAYIHANEESEFKCVQAMGSLPHGFQPQVQPLNPHQALAQHFGSPPLANAAASHPTQVSGEASSMNVSAKKAYSSFTPV